MTIKPVYEPSESEIKQACSQIQKSWSPVVEQGRRLYSIKPATIQGVDTMPTSAQARYRVAKGKQFEQEVAAVLSAIFQMDLRRGQTKKADIDGPDDFPLHVECKSQKSVGLYQALGQAYVAAEGKKPAVVVHKQPRKPPLLTIHLTDLPRLVEACRCLLEKWEREPGSM